MEAAEIKDVLLSSEFFSGLDRLQTERIAALCRVACYQAGESVYSQGGDGDCLFVIDEGQVVLERAVSLGTRKGTVAVAILGKGKVFGGWSTLLDEPHRLMLSAVCQKPARLLVLPGAALRALMTADVRLGFAVLERLCFLLRERILHTLGAMENI